MTVKRGYLRPNVVIEPLVHQWYAWSLLVSPATAAMYLANSHVKLMRSFLANPQMHVAALRNAKMRGGPFIDHGPERADDVRALLARTLERGAPQIAFADAVKALERLLQEEATGLSMETLYPKVPEALRGYVELVYDTGHRPSARFLEGLLYASPYHDTGAQRVVISALGEEKRPFVFSTPRLDQAGQLQVDIPFESRALDVLYGARYTETALGAVADALRLGPGGEEQLAPFFTDEAPRPGAAFDGDGVRIRYLGHACVLVEARGTSILFDPVIGHGGVTGVPHFAHADLPPVIDHVVITHNHQDHIMIEALLELRSRVKHVIVPRSNRGSLIDPSLRLLLRHIGFPSVTEIGEMDEIALGGGRILGVPFFGEHADLDLQSKLAYHVTLQGRSVLLVADSNNLEPRVYEHVQKLTGDVDVLFIGMECEGAPMSWLYGPFFHQPLTRKMDQARRLDGSDFARGSDVVRRFRPGQVYVYAMGQEPWLTYLTSIEYTESSKQIVESNKLVAHCEERGLVSERLFGQKEILLERRG